MNERVYLDYNATAPLRPQARAAVAAALDLCGNASSVHAEGRAARAALEEARGAAAGLVGAAPEAVVFTSGGTEAANLALTPDVAVGDARGGFGKLLIGATEHACVLAGHRFPAEAVERIAVDRHGRLDLDALEAALDRCGAPVMLALQAANSETGVIQPLAQATARVRARGGIVVCDAVQAAGRIPLDVSGSGPDMFVLSAHKLGGPKGAGALVIRSPDIHIRDRVLRGGGQERGMRAGTENVAAIAGFGAACTAALPVARETERLAALRDTAEGLVRDIAPDAEIFGGGADRLANTLAFAVPGLAAETLLMGLDLAGFAVSSGSACSSGKVARSHVLAAMAVPEALARGAVRVSVGWASTPAHVAGFGQALAEIVGRMRRRRPLAA